MAKRKYKKFQTGGYSEFGEEPSSSYMTDDFRAESDMPMTKEEVKEAVKTAKKAPIVTKEELEKSGLSLRDYMNKQQGLTRRGGSSPKETTVEKTVVKTEAPAPSKASAPASTPRVGRGALPMATPPEMKGGTAAGQAAANAKREKQREGMFDNNPLAAIFKSIRKRGEETQGYAKGGSVGSASKRADGIAQRGKTRGKIC